MPPIDKPTLQELRSLARLLGLPETCYTWRGGPVGPPDGAAPFIQPIDDLTVYVGRARKSWWEAKRFLLTETEYLRRNYPL